MITVPEMAKMPDNCHSCPWSYYDELYYEFFCPWYNCAVDYHGGEEKRMRDCPLKESEGID